MSEDGRQAPGLLVVLKYTPCMQLQSLELLHITVLSHVAIWLVLGCIGKRRF